MCLYMNIIYKTEQENFTMAPYTWLKINNKLSELDN